MRIAIVSASLSESSTTQQLGHAIGEAVRGELGGDIVHVSLRELAHAITDNMLTGFPSAELEDAFEKVKSADAVVAVTPAYNASYSGLFKSFFDVLPEETLRGKPVAIGATGGTPRHSLVTEHAIRPMFTYLHAITAPTAVYAATEDFGAHAADSDSSGGSSIGGRIRRVAGELAVIVRSLAGSGAKAEESLREAGAGDGTESGAAKPELDDAEPAAARVGTARASAKSDIDAAKELFDDFKPMDELFG